MAVLGEDRILAEQATDAKGSDDRLHVQAWRHGDDLLDAGQIVLELAAAGASVVCVGADVPLPIAFGVAAIVDRDHPEMSVVLVASPNEDVWREALRAGVRDVIEPGRVDLELDDAIRRAVERTARAREQRPAPPVPEAPTTGRVIVVLSPKGGSGKTMVASNLAAALAQTDKRLGRPRRPRRAVRGLGDRARAHARTLHRSAGDDAGDRLDDAQGVPDPSRSIGCVRAVRVGLARGG